MPIRVSAVHSSTGCPRLGSRLSVLVDCTAADRMETVYEQALLRGIHVVTAKQEAVCRLAAQLSPSFDHVAPLPAGAPLRDHRGREPPVIETLKDLVRTGDRVDLIEGSFSGTLGYLSNELLRGVPLSTAVTVARDRAIPRAPSARRSVRIDVARKAIILARELASTSG